MRRWRAQSSYARTALGSSAWVRPVSNNEANPPVLFYVHRVADKPNLVYAMIYSLVNLRENFTKREEPPQQFSALQFVQDTASQIADSVRGVQENFQRTTGNQQEQR